MSKFLSMPDQAVQNAGIEHVERLQQPRRSKIEDEVLVRFRTSQTRDIVQSYAISLAQSAGRAGLRLEVPNHLRSLFRRFESHGADLRAKHGVVKRAIRFDDTNMSLYMDVRLEDTQWHRITEEDMAAITERRRRGDHGQRNGANCGQERKKILLLSAEDLAGGRDGEEKSGTDE